VGARPLELCFLVMLGLTALVAAATLTVSEPAGSVAH